MSIKNPKLDLVLRNKYMIFGPGRTGSKLIVDLIKNTYYKNNLPCKYFDPSSKIEDLSKHFFVWHHHSIEKYESYLNLNFGHTIKVLSTRDMIDSTYSWAIVNRTNKYHLYYDQNIKVEPFYLPEDEFLSIYNNIVSFYENIGEKNDKDLLIVDYQDFSHNIDYVFDRLNLPKTGIDFRFRIPKKNPGVYKDWILNYEEINLLTNSLSRIPKLG